MMMVRWNNEKFRRITHEVTGRIIYGNEATTQ